MTINLIFFYFLFNNFNYNRSKNSFTNSCCNYVLHINWSLWQSIFMWFCIIQIFSRYNLPNDGSRLNLWMDDQLVNRKSLITWLWLGFITWTISNRSNDSSLHWIAIKNALIKILDEDWKNKIIDKFKCNWYKLNWKWPAYHNLRCNLSRTEIHCAKHRASCACALKPHEHAEMRIMCAHI